MFGSVYLDHGGSGGTGHHGSITAVLEKRRTEYAVAHTAANTSVSSTSLIFLRERVVRNPSSPMPTVRYATAPAGTVSCPHSIQSRCSFVAGEKSAAVVIISFVTMNPQVTVTAAAPGLSQLSLYLIPPTVRPGR